MFQKAMDATQCVARSEFLEGSRSPQHDSEKDDTYNVMEMPWCWRSQNHMMPVKETGRVSPNQKRGYVYCRKLSRILCFQVLCHKLILSGALNSRYKRSGLYFFPAWFHCCFFLIFSYYISNVPSKIQNRHLVPLYIRSMWPIFTYRSS